MLRSYEGGCHCGRVRFRVNADLDTVSVCNCSMCTKKGFLHVVVAAEQFEVLSGAADLTVYEFNTCVAKHRFCRHCGIHSFYTPRSDPHGVDVNARCLDGVDPDTLKPGRFDGRNWEQAIQNKGGPKVTG
jgi:hypothetical protein